MAAGAELAVLPDEPYPFTAGDGPEAFPGIAVALVSGRSLTWYGPSLTTARAELDDFADAAGQISRTSPALDRCHSGKSRRHAVPASDASR